MSEREPNEVSAALRNPASPSGGLREEAAGLIDRLTRDLAQARRERDAACGMMETEAAARDNAELQLSEARVALAKAEGEAEHQHRLYIEMCGESDKVWDALGGDPGDEEPWTLVGSLKERAAAAESSLREQAEAIVVLRDALGCAIGIISIVRRVAPQILEGSDGQDFTVRECQIEQAWEASIPEIASRLSAERRAERDVVRAARAVESDGPLHSVAGWYDSVVALRKALAALPASPLDKEGT